MSTFNATQIAPTITTAIFDIENPRFAVVIIGMIIMAGLEVMVVIVRIRQRFVKLNGRKPHAIIGSGAGKNMRERIQKSLERTVQSLSEPPLLHGDRPTKDYHYRMKVLDEVVALNDVFLENDSRLLRPVGHDFREHLTLLRRSHPTIFDGREPLYNALSTLYEHARFIAKPFGRREYDQFHRLLDYLIKLIRRIKQVDTTISSSDLDVSIPHPSKTDNTSVPEDDNTTKPSSSTAAINITRNSRRISNSPRKKSSNRSSSKDDDSSPAHVVITGISSKSDAAFV